MKKLALLALAVHLPVYGMSWFPEEPEEPVIDVPDGAVSFIAIGDTGTGEEKQYKVAAAMKEVCDELGCDFALGLGDNIYETGVDSVDDVRLSINLKSLTQISIFRSI